MKIGLIDVDGHNFQNLALMKISSFHKLKGDVVEWVNYLEKYDKVYISKVFTFTKDIDTCIQADEIIRGGTGYDITHKLPEEIEECNPDYSIYPQYNFSIQFFSRGCIRNCPFCLVRRKEGCIIPVKTTLLNQKGKYIEVLDNNFFANPLWEDAVKVLKLTKKHVKLRGVDIRLINEKQSLALKSMKLKGNSICIAWDNPREDIIPNIEFLLKHLGSYKITCYVLVGYWSTPEEDLYRVTELVKLGIDPHVQPYRDYENKRIPSKYEKDFSRWANKKELLNSCEFKDYKPRKGFKCSEYFN